MAHTHRFTLATAILAAGLLGAPADAGARKAKPTACRSGRYFVTGAPVIPGAPGVEADTLVVDGTKVSLDSGCAVTGARVKPGKKFTALQVTWRSCRGVVGKATLSAKIDAATCSHLTGTFKAKKDRKKKLKRTFSALRSACGDGTVDPANGEACEPGPNPACAADCTWQAHPTRDDDFYAPAIAAPDFSKITLTPQGDGTTHVQGAAGAVPGPFPVYVASPNSANHAFTTAAADGSFAADVIAPPGAWVLVKYDPTGGAWIDPANMDPLGAPINSALGAWHQVPFSPPAGVGVPFVVAGSAFESRVDWSLAGRMAVASNTVTLTGTLTVYAATSQVGQTPTFSIVLHRLNNASGAPRLKTNQFFSTILTPTGLPIEHFDGPPVAADGISSAALAQTGTNVYTGAVSKVFNLPGGLPAGTYALALSTFGTGLTGPLPGPRREVNPFVTNHEIYLPPFQMGSPAAPRLVWTLLTDVYSADGSRGTIAAEDAAGFELTDRLAVQTSRFIVPRLSKKTGQPLVYRLEPYVPMVCEGERRLANVPTHAFAFPSGSLSATITRPDGAVVTLGPAPFTSAHSRTPASSAGALLDNGGGHLGDVMQLSTDSGIFDYQFPQYGDYRIVLAGSIADVYGNTFTGGGTYSVTVAEPLDLEPAVLPMTPFVVGNALDPALTVLPGVPADVTVEAKLLVDSNPAETVDYHAAGTANRFGYFAPAPGTAPFVMTGPGELLVTTVARYTDASGTLWMGATRWGQVVAPVGSPLVAHGRRETDGTPAASVHQWFQTSLVGSTHAQLPWATGDILWQGDQEAARVQITAQDTGGAIQAAIADWVGQNNYFSPGDEASPTPTFNERTALGEVPLGFSTSTGANPPEEPADIVSRGYWYGGIERPGERVREIVSDDNNGTTYWRFAELYGLQPGMGFDGDLPGDFKFQFGGVVYRDSVHAVSGYGIYGSLWSHLIDADDQAETYVFPPFEGANGGPSNGPILRINGAAIDGFVVPLGVRPGSVLETGKVFSFSAQLAPTLPAAVSAVVTGPAGFSRTVAGRANPVGYFYDPSQDFVTPAPGVYHVAVTATFDAATSAGPMSPPYPTGSVLGAVAGGFDVYVVAADTPSLPPGQPTWSVVAGVAPVTLTVWAPHALQTGTVHYTIAMPGVLLAAGTAPLTNGRASITYDPATLHQTFPNLDVDGRTGAGAGLADTVWVGFALEGSTGTTLYADHVTLQGVDLLHPRR
jgi:hypothetical protein